MITASLPKVTLSLSSTFFKAKAPPSKYTSRRLSHPYKKAPAIDESLTEHAIDTAWNCYFLQVDAPLKSTHTYLLNIRIVSKGNLLQIFIVVVSSVFISDNILCASIRISVSHVRNSAISSCCESIVKNILYFLGSGAPSLHSINHSPVRNSNRGWAFQPILSPYRQSCKTCQAQQRNTDFRQSHHTMAGNKTQGLSQNQLEGCVRVIAPINSNSNILRPRNSTATIAFSIIFCARAPPRRTGQLKNKIFFYFFIISFKCKITAISKNHKNEQAPVLIYNKTYHMTAKTIIWPALTIN